MMRLSVTEKAKAAISKNDKANGELQGFKRAIMNATLLAPRPASNACGAKSVTERPV
jgi:hypothetical protein